MLSCNLEIFAAELNNGLSSTENQEKILAWYLLYDFVNVVSVQSLAQLSYWQLTVLVAFREKKLENVDGWQVSLAQREQ